MVYRDMLLIWNRSKLMLELRMRDLTEMWMYTAIAATARPMEAVFMLRAALFSVLRMSLMMGFLELYTAMQYSRMKT